MVLSIGVNMPLRQCKDWAIAYSLTYPVLSDNPQTVTGQYLPDYGVFLLPHCVIVDDEQILRWTHYAYWYPETIDEILDSLDAIIQPEISSSVTTIDISGEVGAVSSFEIWIDNSRTGILNVTDAYVGGEPFSVDFTPGQIYAVNDSLMITVYCEPTSGGVFTDMLTVVSDAGNLQIPINANVGVGSRSPGDIPQAFELLGNYPNPFNSRTQIEYALPEKTNVKLEIFTTLGSSVMTLTPGEMPAGYHTMNVDANELTSGLYFFELTAGNKSAVGKMLLIK